MRREGPAVLVNVVTPLAMNTFSLDEDTDFFAALLPEILRLVFRSDALSLGDVGRLAQTCHRGWKEVGPWIRDPVVITFYERESIVFIFEGSEIGKFREHLVRCLLADWYRSGIFDLPGIPFLLRRYPKEDGDTSPGCGAPVISLGCGAVPNFACDLHTEITFEPAPGMVKRYLEYKLLIMPWLAHYPGGSFQYAHTVMGDEAPWFSTLRIKPHIPSPAQRPFMYFFSMCIKRVYVNDGFSRTEADRYVTIQGTSAQLLYTRMPSLFRHEFTGPVITSAPRSPVGITCTSGWATTYDEIKASAPGVTPVVRLPWVSDYPIPFSADKYEKERTFFGLSPVTPDSSKM